MSRQGQRAAAALRRSLEGSMARLPPRVQNQVLSLVLRVILALAARAVTQPVRFASREIFRWRGVSTYRLRRSGQSIVVRHPGSDAWVVHEVLGRGVYLPPPAVERAVRQTKGPPRIIDLGANIGSATLLLLERFPDAHVLAIEPDRANADLLRRTIESNGLGAQCDVREVAAGNAPGNAMIAGFAALSHFVREETTEAVDMYPFLQPFQAQKGPPVEVEVIDVLPLLDGADLVKMDIEGAEWAILQDPRFARLSILSIVLEYHPQGAPEEDTTKAARGLLEAAGLTTGDPFDQHDGVGMLWAWREQAPAAE